MLSVFKRLLGRGPAADPSRADTATPLRSLLQRYRPDLIASLRDQHRELLALFAELETASEQHNRSACRWALDRFARALQTHLALENRHLYDYLARQDHADPEVAQRVETMSTDMMHVGRILHRFLTTYSRAAFTPDELLQMRRDLRVVGEVLAHRIHEEESVLYPLYAPPAI